MRYLIRRPIRRSFAPFAVAILALTWSATALAGGGDHASKRDKLGFWDSRHAPAAQQVLDATATDLSENAPAASEALKDSLGDEGILSLDPLTRTARFVGKTDGFLTGPSSAPAADIAMRYIKKNAAALGLNADALAALRLANDYVDIIGTHHLSFTQQVDTPDGPVTVFGNGIKVGVVKDGRIINVTGSPVGALTPTQTSPTITAAEAIVAAKRDVGAAAPPVTSTQQGDLTTFASGDNAKLVYFKTVGGLRLAYRTLLLKDGYISIVDAGTGRVLYRDSTVDSANGLAWDNRPAAATGGTQHSFDVNGPGGSWNFGAISPLIGTDAGLSSNNVWVYSDVNGSNGASLSELVRADATGNFNYALTPFTDALKSPCVAAYPCTWSANPATGAFSWRTNRAQNATQVYFFLNTFHDHLAAAPIGFTEGAGNFQLVNSSGQGFDGDFVLAENDDGANTQLNAAGQPNGFPDANHFDNANMNTPPDGFNPRMQMFLFNTPLGPDPFVQSNGGDEASIVYHEYTHGLSNRLVVDADGNSTLGNIESGAMGEAWSDWYALDYLNNQGVVKDKPGVADVLEGEYVSGGDDLIRTEATDCKVGTSNADPGCDGDPDGTAGTGGYTYGDYGKIIGRPEVHADGEIWGQTLWDLRDALGSAKTEMIVTRGMELAPANPSFLDMRNSILQGDLAAFNGGNRDTIWKVFAHRGMGFFAAAVDGDDAFPAEDFQLPPRSKRSGLLAGIVVDNDTRRPIAGATVEFGGHSSGFATDIAGVTNKFGVYAIKKILIGKYPKVSASAPGYDRVTRDFVVIERPLGLLAWKLRRNYASLAGGGTIADFTGPDFTPFGCGPYSAIDDSEGNGWGSTTDDADGNSTGNVTPKFVVVKLPQTVTVSEIKVNPSNTCGDPGSSSTRGYRIQVSADGTTFTTLTQGVFYAGNRAIENTVFTGSQASVRYVKFWMLNPQVPTDPNPAANCTSAADCGTNPDDNSGVAAHCGPGKDNGYGGCPFMDMSEIKVYGRP